jgi:hypothetical protein
LHSREESPSHFPSTDPQAELLCEVDDECGPWQALILSQVYWTVLDGLAAEAGED